VTAQGRGGCKDRVTGAALIDPLTGLPYPCLELAGTINSGGIGQTELIVTLCDGWLYNGVTVPLARTSAPTCGGTPTPPPDVVIPKKPTITIFGGTYVYDALERPATGDQTNGAFTTTAGHRVAVVPPKAYGAGGTAEPLLPLPTVTYVDANNQPVTVPIAVGSYIATAYFPGNATYSPLIISAPITILSQVRSTPAVTVTGGIFRYDGQPHPATGVTTMDASSRAAIITPATVVYYNCPFNPAAGWNPATDAACTTTPPINTTTTKVSNVTPADGIPVLAYFPGNTMYAPAYAEARIAIWAPRPSVTTTTGFTVPYDGLPHPSTPTTRDATDNVNFPITPGLTVVSYTFNGASSGVPLNAGAYPVQAVFPGDNVHSGSTGTNTIIITPLTATIAMTAAAAACDSQPHGATGTVRSASGALLGTPAFMYSDAAGNVLPAPPTAAGVYTVLATLPPGLALNYRANPATVSTTLTITVQTATIRATGGTFVFDGAAHPASVTVTGAGLPAGTQPVITYTRNGVVTGTPTAVGVYTATASLPASVACVTATPATTTITITAPPAPAPEEACLVVDLREITYFKNSSVITSSDSSVRSKNGLSGGFKPSLWPYSATGGSDTTGSRGTLFRIYGFKATEVGVGIPDLDVPGKTYPVKEDTQIPGPGRFYVELNEPGGPVGGHPARVFICPSQLQANVIDQNVCRTSTGGGDDKDGKDSDGKDGDGKDGKDGGKDGSGSAGKDAVHASSYGDDGKDGKDSGSGDDGKDGKDGGGNDDSSCSNSDDVKDGKDGKDAGTDDGKDGKDGGSDAGKDGKDTHSSRSSADGKDGKDGKDSGGGDDGKDGKDGSDGGKDGGCTSCTQDDGVFTNSSVLTASEKNVPGIMLAHNASALTVPQRVRTELGQLGIPLQSPPGTPATRAAVDYIAVQHWGGGTATYREFVDVRVTFIDDSRTDRRQHYAAGLHTATNLNAASAFGCDYLDADPTNDTIRLNDNWDGTHVGDPNWGPACGALEPSQNQKKRETADVMYNTAQLLMSVNTDSDTVRLFFGELRALPAASAAPSVSGTFTTYTQGGWGASPSGNNPGALLASKFATVYPGGSVNIGGTNRLTFTSAGAIVTFLPQGGTPGVLTASATNPTSSSAGVFAGQVLALRLNVDFSTAGVTKVGLASKKIVSGKLAGATVAQVLTLANSVIGGSTAWLPAGVSLSDLNAVVDAINNNYDNGTPSKGYLQ
jgi:hypothetical protein